MSSPLATTMMCDGRTTSLQLAPELLFKIVDLVPLSSLLSLCLVCRHINVAATTALYDVLHLDSNAKMVRCCRTISHRKDIALVVKSLIIQGRSKLDNLSATFDDMDLESLRESLSPRVDRARLGSFYRVFNDALSQMSNLTHLELVGDDIDFKLVLQRCSFPDLKGFCFSADFCAELGVFLNNHLTLERLYLPSIFVPLALPRFPFSRLSVLYAPADFVRRQAPGSPMKSVDVTTFPVDTALEATLRSLARSTGPIEALSYGIVYWSRRFIIGISMVLPDIQFIDIEVAVNMLEDEDEVRFVSILKHIYPHIPFREKEWELYRELDVIMSSFTQLQTLIINAPRKPLRKKHRSMNDEYSTLQVWSERCPSLIQSALLCGVIWRRQAHRLWSPDYGHPWGPCWINRTWGSYTPIAETIWEHEYRRAVVEGEDSLYIKVKTMIASLWGNDFDESDPSGKGGKGKDVEKEGVDRIARDLMMNEMTAEEHTGGVQGDGTAEVEGDQVIEEREDNEVDYDEEGEVGKDMRPCLKLVHEQSSVRPLN
ncbi:hypothetical protein JAAARDRAFT_228415 [Jaapia argillacea MUCL 33604]|uniref:F-box domain-containing protein n=1 Tax=Jaapia argillacea MUCL 33604 TaxID=933084 RepID=A0A067QEC0_9AGAM|nr:hypothetical protein JAAARDRAFT_228415 [Jaapia argillacea MUCL 33604]